MTRLARRLPYAFAARHRVKKALCLACLRMRLQGSTSLLTVGTAHELALAMFVLQEASRSDATQYLVTVAAELATLALRVRGCTSEKRDVRGVYSLGEECQLFAVVA